MRSLKKYHERNLCSKTSRAEKFLKEDIIVIRRPRNFVLILLNSYFVVTANDCFKQLSWLHNHHWALVP